MLKLVYTLTTGQVTAHEGHVIDKATVVGRGHLSDLYLDSMHVSRQHAQLAPATWGPHGEQVILVTDLGSKNGTFVNGKAIAPGEPVRAIEGDVVMFGSLCFTVVALSPAEAAEEVAAIGSV